MKWLCWSYFLIASLNLLEAQTPTIATNLTYLVNVPKQKTAKPPVVIVLHGYGANEKDLFDITKSFDDRFLSFSLRAPYSKDGACWWYAIEWKNDSIKTHNYTELKESEKQIFSFISQACKAYNADSNRVYIMGFSQGAIIAYDMLLRKPNKIKGILALSGKLLPQSKAIQTSLKPNENMCFIAHGRSDNVIKPIESEIASAYFKSLKAQVSFNSYEMPHSISGDELNDIKQFLKKQLDPPKSK